MKTIVKDDSPNTDFEAGDLVRDRHSGAIIKVTSIESKKTFSGIILYSKIPVKQFKEEYGWSINNFKKFNGELIFKN